MRGLLRSPLFVQVYVCANVGPQALLAAAWPAQFHNPPPRWVRQSPPCHESSPSLLPVSAPPTGLGECFFFNSLVTRLPYSSIFCQFWLFLFLNWLLSFFWLSEAAKRIYLHLHLGQKSALLILNDKAFFPPSLLPSFHKYTLSLS